MLGPAVASKGAVVSGRVTVKEQGLVGPHDKKDASGVLVYLEGVPGPPPMPTQGAAIRQRDKSFVPRTLVVTRGSAVDFPNDDKIFHNVFSLSKAGKFDLGLYKSGASRKVVFDRAGEVDVYCNIHPDMVATIKVLDEGYYAMTDREGRFRIEGVPAGTFPIVAWEPRSPEARGTVTVGPSGVAEVHLELVEGQQAASHHLRKDGTPYGRYQ
jgi:plastocyanin